MTGWEELSASLHGVSAHGLFLENLNLTGMDKVYAKRKALGMRPSGLSGTRFKVGGPTRLQCFVLEQAISVKPAMAGGNASLMTTDRR
jgi:hypothetical protein